MVKQARERAFVYVLHRMQSSKIEHGAPNMIKFILPNKKDTKLDKKAMTIAVAVGAAVGVFAAVFVLGR